MQQTTDDGAMEGQQCSVRAAQPPGRGWRTAQDRTRLLVAYLWDGRCGHCSRPLVRVHELGLLPVPLDVDHVLPTALGGRDELMNYIASCAGCNRSRQANLIDDGTVIKGRPEDAAGCP